MHRILLPVLAVALLAASPALAQDPRTSEISFAAAEGDLRGVTRVLDSGFDVNTQWGTFNQSALLKAAEWGQTAVVRLLLERGANPRLTDSSGRTPLAWALNNRHDEVARILRQAEGLPADQPEQRRAPAPEPRQVPPAPPAPAAEAARAPQQPAATEPADGARPQDGRWRGTVHGITNGGTQYVSFVVKGGRIVDSTFHLDYHCAPQYVYRERATVGFDQPIVVERGRFAATRKAPAVELTASGRFVTPATAEGTFKMEDSNLCTTRLARWTAQRTGP